MDMKRNKKTDTDRGFTVIGAVKPKKIAPAQVTQPDWIRNPILFDGNINSTIPVEILEQVVGKVHGVQSLFPVQAKLIPYLTKSLKMSGSLRPRDVCVSSPTGSGKTLAFVLPLIHHLKHYVETKLRAIIVVPVAELVTQIKNVFDSQSEGTRLKVHASSSKINSWKDIELLSRTQVDVIVSTPRRLLDLINSSCIDVKHLQVLVIDEADRLNAEGDDRLWLHELEKAVYGDVMNSNLGCLCSNTSSQRIALGFGCGCSMISYNFSCRRECPQAMSSYQTDCKLQDKRVLVLRVRQRTNQNP